MGLLDDRQAEDTAILLFRPTTPEKPYLRLRAGDFPALGVDDLLPAFLVAFAARFSAARRWLAVVPLSASGLVVAAFFPRRTDKGSAGAAAAFFRAL